MTIFKQTFRTMSIFGSIFLNILSSIFAVLFLKTFISPFVRVHTIPGEEAQVDFGYPGMSRDDAGKNKKT